MSAMLLITDTRSGQQKRMRMGRQELRIGKSAENDLVLDRIGISRLHCRLVMESGRLVAFDNDSRNGTFVDGMQIRRPTPVNPGQTITVGDFTIVVESTDTPAGASTPQTGSTPSNAAAQPVPQKPLPPKAPEPQRLVTPVELKRKIHTILIDRMDLKHTDMSKISDADLREKTAGVCRQIIDELRSELPGWLSPEALIREIVNEAVGLGLLEDLLDDSSVDEIMVCAWDKIYVERKGKIELTPYRFTDNLQVVAIIRRILAPIGRRIDETTPMADGRLVDGSRVNAIIPPLALSGPTLTIRKFAATPFMVDDLIRFGSMNRHMADFLALAVKHRANIVISGGTGSGKTTLLNVTSNYIPSNERIVTVEDSAELQLAQPHVVRLESRPANLEGKNAIHIRDLVKNCLRMRPDRIVVGECRGGEALDMLQAMNTGHDGSLTTLHANSPRDAISRMETLVLMAGMELPARAIREQIASAVDFIVQQTRLPDGSRKVIAITEVCGMEGDVITMQPIFQYVQEGFDAGGNVKGHFEATGAIPHFVQLLRQRGIPVEMALFGQEDNG